MWENIPTPNKPCSYCHDPYHHVRDYSSTRQFSNHSYGHMNTSFSRSEDDDSFDFYNPTWSQQSNLSWHAQALGNLAPQFHGQSYSFLNTVANMQLLEYMAKVEAYQEEHDRTNLMSAQ